jgi:hypothetical protein
MWEPRRLTTLWASTACVTGIALPFFTLPLPLVFCYWHYNFMWISDRFHVCYIPCPFYLTWFEHRNICWAINIMKSLIMQFYACYLLSVTSKYFPLSRVPLVLRNEQTSGHRSSTTLVFYTSCTFCIWNSREHTHDFCIQDIFTFQFRRGTDILLKRLGTFSKIYVGRKYFA